MEFGSVIAVKIMFIVIALMIISLEIVSKTLAGTNSQDFS